MPQPMGFHVRLGWSGWLTLLIVLGLVFAIAAIVAIRSPRRVHRAAAGRAHQRASVLFVPRPQTATPGAKEREADIIEGEYRVVDPRQLERDVPPGDRA